MDHFEVVDMSELKVGDVVSIFDEKYQEWTAERVVKIHDMSEFETTSSYLHLFPAVFMTKWVRGIHESLIPEGFAIVPIEPTDKMVSGGLYPIKNKHRNTSICVWKAMLDAAPKPTDK